MRKASSPKAYKVPPTLGACADKLLQLRDERVHLEAMVEESKQHAQAITKHLIDKLPVDDAEGVVGRKAVAVVKRKAVPTLMDWKKFCAHIVKKKAFDLLEHRVSKAAVKERWEAGERIPGVDKFNVATISLTKK